MRFVPKTRSLASSLGPLYADISMRGKLSTGFKNRCSNAGQARVDRGLRDEDLYGSGVMRPSILHLEDAHRLPIPATSCGTNADGLAGRERSNSKGIKTRRSVRPPRMDGSGPSSVARPDDPV